MNLNTYFVGYNPSMRKMVSLQGKYSSDLIKMNFLLSLKNSKEEMEKKIQIL